MIKTRLQKIILTIIGILCTLSSSVLAATIITSEISTDSDEMDQAIEVDLSTDAEKETLGEETYTIKQKVTQELEKQIKQDIAGGAKAEIDSVVYYEEYELRQKINAEWKSVKNKEISEENLDKIIYSYSKTLTEYGAKKIDAWINTYYTSNSNTMISKVVEYVDGDESDIEDGVSIVAYIALENLFDEMTDISEKITNKVPDMVKTVLNRYVTVSSWEERAVEATCMEIELQIKNELESAFASEFGWEDKKLAEAYEAIDPFTEEISDNFADEVMDQMMDKISDSLGYYNNLTWEEVLIKYGLTLLDDELSLQFEYMNKLVDGEILSIEDLNQYNKRLAEIKADKIADVQKEHDKTIDYIENSEYKKLREDMINDAKAQLQKQLDKAESTANELEKKEIKEEAQKQYDKQLEKITNFTDEQIKQKMIKDAEAKLKEDLKKAEKEADKEARQEMKDEAIKEYNEAMEKLKEEANIDAEAELKKETDKLIDSVKKGINEKIDNLTVDSILIKKEQDEAEKEYEKKIDEINKEYSTDLTPEEKREKAEKENVAKIEYESKIEAIDEQLKQENISVEDKTRLENEKKQAKTDYDTRMDEIDKEYTKQDLTPEKKAEMEAKKNAAKEQFEAKKEEIEKERQRIKEEREAAFKDQFDVLKKQKKELESKYKEELAKIEAKDNGNLDAAGKKALEEEKRKLKEDYQKAKKEIENKQSELRKQEQAFISEDTKKAVEFVSNMLGELAGSFTDQLWDNINQKMHEWSKNLGAIGQGVVTAITTQVTNWAREQIVNNVTNLIQNAFGLGTGKLEISKFKINYTDFTIQILWSWAMSNEKLAEILSGYGSYVTPPVMYYETMAEMPFLFMARSGITLIPSLEWYMARKTADKYEDVYLGMGDTATNGGNPFGTNENKGYNPLQFLPAGSATIELTIRPFIVHDNPTITLFTTSQTDPVPLPPILMGGFFAMNVTVGKVIPNITVGSAPLIGPFWDSAYVLCEFAQNAGNDAYVQRAFTRTSLSQLTVSVPFEQTKYSAALVKEAQKYATFSQKVTSAGGYSNTLKNLTNDEELKVRYLSEQDWFLVGPFKVDYLKSRVETEFRATDIGVMTDMKIYYRDTETNEEREISKDTWTLLFSENGEVDLDFSSDRYAESYIYPYPKEEFYIAIDKDSNPDVTNISKLAMKFKEMQVIMAGSFSDLTYSVIWNQGGIVPIISWHSITFYKWVNRFPTMFVYNPFALFTVHYAKRYYMKHTFEITIDKKAVANPAYETEEYTTSTTIKTTGAEDTDIIYGEETNSALFDSVETLLKNYNGLDRDKFNDSGETFEDSVSNLSQIHLNADGDTVYIQAINAILKAMAENDASKSLSLFANLTSSPNEDFAKIAKIAKYVSEKQKVRELATVIDTAVEIYKNTNDNVGMEILNLLNEVSIIYENDDFAKIMDSINQTINNCEHKAPVFALLSQIGEIELTNERMDMYLQTMYPYLNQDNRGLVMSVVKNIVSILNNTGDLGNTIALIIKNAYKLYEGTATMSDLINVIVEKSNDKDLQDEYRIFMSVLQIEKHITEINEDSTLSEQEKYKYIQEEQIKIFKATSIIAKQLNDGETLVDAIEKSYGETSNIEKQIFTKFQTVVKDMEVDEVTKLTESLIKSKDVENTLDIINAEMVRNNLKDESEKASTFIDIKEESSSLYDRTAYTEFDPNFNILKVERPADVYYMGDDKLDLTMTIAGVVWKDGHTGLQNDYDGVRMANTNGDIEKGVEGVQVTLINAKTNEIGKMKVNGRWQPTITYTDEGGYYHFEEVESSQYYVKFTYDGHKYMATTSLSDGEKRTTLSNYEQYPDLEMYDNNSKAAENADERQAFNNKFYEIRGESAFTKDGEILNVNGQTVGLEYEEKDGVAELITLDNAGHVLPQFAMSATTQELGITYPIDENVTLDDQTTTTLTSQYLQQGMVYGEYKKTGEYMYHVNLGLVERTKLDLATTQDVYEVTTTVNEKQETYIYNQRGGLSVFDAKLKQTETYSGVEYTRELYNADYQLRLEDYDSNSLNKLDRNGNDKSAEIAKIKEIKELEYAKGGLEERVFVTYKITLKNQSMLQSAKINELTDYFDSSYKLVTEDIYQEIQNSEGIVENKLVAKQSFFIVQAENSATEYKLFWEETGMVNGLKSMHTVQTSQIGLEDVMLKAQDEIYVFITFELDKDANRALQLGKKENIVEISSYSSFEIGSENFENSIGLIDKDSAPDNLSVGQRNSYEDDTDAAPIIEFKLYSTDLRNVNGFVWNDDRDVKLSTGQIVGNGVREEKEELIDGVRVQLVEIVRDPLTGAEYEYVWKEMYTGEDSYSHIGSSGSIANTERGQTVSTGSIISDTNLGAVQKGEYKFYNYIAGNFIVRYIYGDTYKTYLTKGSENAEGEGRNEASFNGHDYKSTAYLKGNNLYAEWYDLSGFDKEDKLYSDAKDDVTRRNKVIEYASTIQNDKAEILASFDDRDEKYYYDRSLHQDLRDNTWMFADTAKINVNIEYNTTKANGLDNLTYRIKNMDFGIEKRPETKLELTKEITDIKVTLASGETIINTAAGMSQNVNWPRNEKTAIVNNGTKTRYNKRDSLRYEYRQGNAHIYMDEEVMQGTNIQFTFKITITNNSEIDYTGQNGNLGYTYFTGQVGTEDKIVTTTVNKIIDYVDNSLTFRKVDSPDWSLIETMREFITTEEGVEIEVEKMDYGTYIEKMMAEYGEDYVADHLREFEAQYQVYLQTGKIQGIGNIGVNTEKTEEEDTTGSHLANYNVIQNMKDRENSIGYLHEDLSIVKTKSAKVSQEPITQIIVTEALADTELKPGQSASVELILSKTLSPNDEDDTLNYGNLAEILQYSNSVGRRDMDAIPGNQEPDEDPYEYDTDYTERILITPPYGANKAFYFVLTTAVLAILAGGIILIKKKVIDRK